MKNELFIIDSNAWEALKRDEVEATARDLRELGLFKLPYDVVDVQIAAKAIFTSDAAKYGRSELWDERTVAILRDLSLDPTKPAAPFIIRWMGRLPADLAMFHLDGTVTILMKRYGTDLDDVPTKFSDTETGEVQKAANNVVMGLIVLLATRNAVKTRHENKLAKLGIGKKKHPYRYTTTISLPRELDDADGESKPTGEHKRPHLRRGHIRRQHYGPRMTFVKKVFIEPVFVNADRDWVDTRIAYNVSLRTKESI